MAPAGVAASAAAVVTTPFDVVKTKQQTAKGKPGSIAHCLAKVRAPCSFSLTSPPGHCWSRDWFCCLFSLPELIKHLPTKPNCYRDLAPLLTGHGAASAGV